MSRSDAGDITLAELRTGQRARVRVVDGGVEMRARLHDLGLVPGTSVRALFASQAGDPVAYRFRGTTLALRAVDATKVRVELMTEVDG